MPVYFLNEMSHDILRQLAGERCFERGENYFDEERVRSLVEFEGTTLAATVEGTEDYRVRLWGEVDAPGYSCECPFADEGNFCKHCVAVSLAWIAAGRNKRGVTKFDGVRDYLVRQDKNTLVEMLLRAALDSERLCDHLLLEVERTKNL